MVNKLKGGLLNFIQEKIMKKVNVLAILLQSVFLIVFNVLFFLLGGFEHETSIWIAYAFIHVAYLMLLITPLITNKSDRNSVMGYSIYSISSYYFVFTFVINLAFILFTLESSKVAIAFNVIVTGIYAVILISNLMANEHTKASTEQREQDLNYIKKVLFVLDDLKEEAIDVSYIKGIERISDDIKSSPTRSSASVGVIETQILNEIKSLYSIIENADTEAFANKMDSIKKLIKNRNRTLKSEQ